METKSVLEMARGAIIERVDYEVPKIIENLLDANTDPSKKRELTVVLKFSTDDNRQNIIMTSDVKPPKLAPTNSVITSLYVTRGEEGGMNIIELTPQIPGQLNVDGNEQPEPVKLKIIGGQ